MDMTSKQLTFYLVALHSLLGAQAKQSDFSRPHSTTCSTTYSTPCSKPAISTLICSSNAISRSPRRSLSPPSPLPCSPPASPLPPLLLQSLPLPHPDRQARVDALSAGTCGALGPLKAGDVVLVECLLLPVLLVSGDASSVVPLKNTIY